MTPCSHLPDISGVYFGPLTTNDIPHLNVFTHLPTFSSLLLALSGCISSLLNSHYPPWRFGACWYRCSQRSSEGGQHIEWMFQWTIYAGCMREDLWRFSFSLLTLARVLLFLVSSVSILYWLETLLMTHSCHCQGGWWRHTSLSCFLGAFLLGTSDLLPFEYYFNLFFILYFCWFMRFSFIFSC